MISKIMIAVLVSASMCFMVSLTGKTIDHYKVTMEKRYQQGDTAIAVSTRGRM